MPEDAVSRRRLLAGAAATLPLAACTVPSRGNRIESGSRDVPRASAARNVRDFGAVGDGETDDTQAIARAFEAGEGPVILHLPAGRYLVNEWPETPDFSTITGDGADVSTIIYPGDGTLISLREKHRVNFQRLGIYVTGARGTAVSLSNSFRCSFDSVIMRGSHLSDNYPQFVQQRGVVLDDNTGGTAFVNSDINNFGVGVVTSCIQNYVTSSKFASNYIGVLGTGNDHNAGLALVNVEFVSDSDPSTTKHHIRVDGAANDWWLTNVWFEGADVALSIGDRGRGGPAQFGLVNCKVAARSVCLDLVYCRQPYLANVQFDRDVDVPPIEVRVDADGCPEGTAVNLISSASADVDPRSFPDGWSVTGRGAVSRTVFVGPVVTRAGVSDEQLLQAESAGGELMSAILSSGAWLSDRADSGVILKDAAGGYWRLTVSPDGRMETASLGLQRPSR